MATNPKNVELDTLFERQQLNVRMVRARDAGSRVERLRAFEKAIIRNTPKLYDAIFKDYGKSAAEVELTELFTTLAELRFAKRNLHKWVRPTRVRTPLAMFGTQSVIHYEPKGVALIIGAWNYPFSLVVIPLISALAAGNCAILKPSELTPHTSAFIVDLISEVFPPEEVAVVTGGPDVCQYLCGLPFDHIFFTGSTAVGKKVSEAAARNLASCTLELGGKSPVIVTESADLKSAAERIVWGKFLNSGQTCVAPDYVFVPESRAAELAMELKRALTALHANGSSAPNNSLCKIIDTRHFARLKNLLEQAVGAGATVEVGGATRETDRFIEPTIVSKVLTSSPLMQEEIFGPILPLLTYKQRSEAYDHIRFGGKPLALYIFSSSTSEVNEILNNTTSGGVTVNNTLVHLLNPHLPFGGAGLSGLGSYHGLYGFKAFSHERAVLRQTLANGLRLMYPPYTSRVRRCISLATRFMT